MFVAVDLTYDERVAKKRETDEMEKKHFFLTFERVNSSGSHSLASGDLKRGTP